jgi:hypothetical protein
MTDHAANPPEELVIKASLKKGLLICLLSGGFLALSIWLIAKNPVVGWMGAVFGGLGILASLLMLRPNYMVLRLDSEGFDFVRGTRHNRTRWRDVQGFSLGRMSGNKMIGIHYAPDYAAARTARSVAASLAGIEGAIGDHYAMPIEELLETMEAYRKRYS